MIIKVIKEVSVDVTDKEITDFRKSYPAITERGVFSKDSIIAWKIAVDKAIDDIIRFKSSVKTTTTIDEQIPNGLNNLLNK